MNKQETLISFRNASLGYQHHSILKGVSLSIGRQDCVGILGPNGAGKSTFLKSILGLISPVAGQIEISKGVQARFGYVPQKEKLDSIYPLSARDVVEMGTYRSLNIIERFHRNRNDDLVSKYLKECGAHSYSHRRFSQLSGGQKQRVLIARALVTNPQILVLDEPLAGLDVLTQTALLELFQTFKEEKGLTFLIVSHRLRVEKKLFSHIAWVNNGHVDFGPLSTMMGNDELIEHLRNDL